MQAGHHVVAKESEDNKNDWLCKRQEMAASTCVPLVEVKLGNSGFWEMSGVFSKTITLSSGGTNEKGKES
jgi:hypothetical protein